MKISAVELEAYLDQVGNEAYRLRYQEPTRAVEICQEAILRANDLDGSTRTLMTQIARVKLILANLFISLSAYDEALTHALEAHGIYEEIELLSGIARSLNVIGLVNLHLGNYAEGLSNLLLSLNHAETANDQRLKVNVCSNLGLLYLRMEDYSQALEYLQQGVTLVEENDPGEPQSDLYENICIAYLNLGKYSRALIHGQKSVVICRNNQNRYGEAQALSTVGEVYAAMGHTIEALNYYEMSLKLSSSVQYIHGCANAHFLIGDLEFQQGELETALHHLDKALEYAMQDQDKPQTYRCHLVLSKVYREKHQFEQALAHYEKFHRVKETVFNDDMSTKIKSLEVTHRVREMQQDGEIYRLKNVELTREIEERKKVQAELERIITLDPLTGLFNRRHFFELTRQELERSQRYSRHLSVIMLDIDHFKLVNDRFGHLIGDRVLVEVARRIQQALRRIDLACRYGGEEFAILLPETSMTQAEMVATRLWRLVTHQPTVSGGLKLKIGVSVGVACYYEEKNVTVDILLDRADRAMYAAKDAGRNQVKLYSEDMNGNEPGRL